MLKGKWDSKYVNWGITALCVICAAILFFFLLLKLDLVFQTARMILGIAAPIIYGLVLCYILRPVYNRIERRFVSVPEGAGPVPSGVKKFARAMSTVMTLALLLIVIFTLVELILPQLLTTIYSIVDSMPDNLKHFSEWLSRLFEDHPEWEKPVMNVVTEITTKLGTWAETEMIPQISSIVTNVSLGVIGFFTALLDVVVGLIVCVYVLNSKEKFCAQSRKLCFAFLPGGYARKILRAVRFVDKVFSGFINGKLLDSLIIGIICFVCLRLMGMPYVMLISVIVGVTNIIPFFGPFIGAIPSAVLILLVSPMQCLYFILFILILQQVDGNIIGPKILGDSTGLSSFWVIFAILLFGGLFGFPGMVLGVPTFAVFYHFVKYMAEKFLRDKGLPPDTDDYTDPGFPAKN